MSKVIYEITQKEARRMRAVAKRDIKRCEDAILYMQEMLTSSLSAYVQLDELIRKGKKP